MRRLALALALAVASVLPAAGQTIVLKAGHSAAVDEPYQVGLTHFAKQIKEATGGKVDVQIFPNNQLGNEREMIEGLKLSTIDVAVPSSAVLTNFVPDLVTLDMPFLFRTQEHLENALNGPLVGIINEAASKRGFRIIGLYTAGVRHIMTTKKSINTIDDLKGLKIRTMQNTAHVETFKALGANPTPLAYGELYGALQSGVVDGAEAANTNYDAKKFWEVAPHWAMVSWTVLISPLIMSEAKYKALPEDVRKAIDKAGQDSAIVERKEYARSDNERLDALKKAGVKITTPDPKGFMRVSDKVYAMFIKTDAQKAMLKAIQDTK